ncbi:hypothetical protein DEO72_LG7g3065 [Vigna unguiculata]|uniref:F-box domain-containing protein n=1 Tax=Vigna unguiculata TaxID=3917 RepID=A0A4D6MPI8_VIGUN|nr:hypothetical protein DEO72_LG7g3065 [Vigna unguiculata]
MNREKICGRNSSNSTREESEKKLRDGEKEEDRFTVLPDEIILRILSFVDAKIAVQTSVLNKRCRNLWVSLPVFNFDDSSFEDVMVFEDFIDNFFYGRDASTNVFDVNLECHDELEDGDLVDSVIDHVTDTPSIFNTIEALKILAECVVTNLPQLSLCKSLTSLKLCYIVTENTNFNLPSIKHIYLQDCKFECGEENFLQHGKIKSWCTKYNFIVKNDKRNLIEDVFS